MLLLPSIVWLMYFCHTDIGGRQLENAAIVFSSWQKPPLLIDPYNEGVDQLRRLSASMHQHRLIDLDTDTRLVVQVVTMYNMTEAES